ncbi:hypothetical protein O7C57_03305 [Providencia sp. 21OH12SH02B-Prov]|uniref:hypothetical protein n=1 Tax=Providencia sp. 21OH12SH02B-Prov TaxID=3015951 RepID=UPI0022B6FF5B|nr:hypothetical protein [Providencia sp. 21OH12SH02B-Prov]WBA57630.1 hypothetical protein O7C57_03305 [Providencia sp. 21OH12SH02B-Prov]
MRVSNKAVMDITTLNNRAVEPRKISKITAQNLFSFPFFKKKPQQHIPHLNEIFYPPASYFSHITQAVETQQHRPLSSQSISALCRSENYRYTIKPENYSFKIISFKINEKPPISFVSDIQRFRLNYITDKNQTIRLTTSQDVANRFSSNTLPIMKFIEQTYQDDLRKTLDKLIIDKSQYKLLCLDGVNNHEINIGKVASSNAIDSEFGFQGLRNLSSILDMDVENIIQTYRVLEDQNKLQEMPVKVLVDHLLLRDLNNGSVLLLKQKLADIYETTYQVTSNKCFELINIKNKQSYSNIKIKTSTASVITLYKKKNQFIMKYVNDTLTVNIKR